MRYIIDDAIFAMFPDYCRGVVVARGLNNSAGAPELGETLQRETAAVAADQSLNGLQHPRLTAWKDAYRRFGANPEKETPSICFLIGQVKAGKPIRSISPLVDIFNIFSLRHRIPCGGDDLKSMQGDLKLCVADGSETFSPLFKAKTVEHPMAGEVIYVTPQTGRVMCRRWNWRNADFSKILPETSEVAINLDGMQPFISREEISDAAQAMAQLIQSSCGGTAESVVLDKSRKSFEL